MSVCRPEHPIHRERSPTESTIEPLQTDSARSSRCRLGTWTPTRKPRNWRSSLSDCCTLPLPAESCLFPVDRRGELPTYSTAILNKIWKLLSSIEKINNIDCGSDFIQNFKTFQGFLIPVKNSGKRVGKITASVSSLFASDSATTFSKSTPRPACTKSCMTSCAILLSCPRRRRSLRTDWGDRSNSAGTLVACNVDSLFARIASERETIFRLPAISPDFISLKKEWVLGFFAVLFSEFAWGILIL